MSTGERIAYEALVLFSKKEHNDEFGISPQMPSFD